MKKKNHKTQNEIGGADKARGQPGGLSTRREFVAGSLAVSCLALPGLPKLAAAQPCPPAGGSPELQKIGEIRSQGGKLRAVITVQSGDRLLPSDPNLGTPDRKTKLRYFEGKDSAGNVVWPPAPSQSGVPPPALPGPTLRARVGDQVEITFLNHINVEDFPGESIDRAETGLGGCDETVSESGTKIYPEGAGDRSPDCFHRSSTVNIHFHGTHVTPDGLGDNVLLQLRPNLEVTETTVQKVFAEIFAHGTPAHWSDLPEEWRDLQLFLLRKEDYQAIWKGVRGTVGHPELPPEQQLLPQAEMMIRNGLWPQYQIGAYPFCYTLTKYMEDAKGNPTPYEMGQSPGTHWYHAHKHGSTAINVLNGMAGVFVIEGEYDDAFVRLYPNLKQTEKVLIVQNFSDAPNLMSQIGFRPPALWINGQINPTITMHPGEIQLWRFVNASVRAVTTLLGFDQEGGEAPDIRQIAQDGVQFCYENYERQPIRTLPTIGKPRPYSFAPGNRVDILVKAPMQAKSYEFKVIDTTHGSEACLLMLKVEGESTGLSQDFPNRIEDYPAFPPYLKDIDPDSIRIYRKLDFGWEAEREAPGIEHGAEYPAAKFMIDGKQFEDGRYDQTMVLGDAEEWTLTNSTATIAHPFHIHINPFQVVEIYDPSAAPNKLYKPDKNFVWQDVIAIPPSILDGDGKVVDKGYVKIRHRFVDFPGSFVLHCHMLAHEDRGMMQLVRVIPAETPITHH